MKYNENSYKDHNLVLRLVILLPRDLRRQLAFFIGFIGIITNPYAIGVVYGNTIKRNTIMNWKEKSNEIASAIIDSMDEDFSRDTVRARLQEAAYAGMVFECDNWVMKRI